MTNLHLLQVKAVLVLQTTTALGQRRVNNAGNSGPLVPNYKIEVRMNKAGVQSHTRSTHAVGTGTNRLKALNT